MRITFMILPKLQICPWAPKLQEILRGRDCLRSEEYRVMDETIKMTPPVKLRVGCRCLRCFVHMIDVMAMASGPCVILWVQHETFCVAGWLVSPVRWIWPDDWWKKTQGVAYKDWGQHLIVEWGVKGRRVTPGKKWLFSPYITRSSLTMFERDIFSANGSVVTDRRTHLRAAGDVCLTFKKKDVSWQLAKYHICLSLHLRGRSWAARWWGWVNLSINCVRAALSFSVQQL